MSAIAIVDDDLSLREVLEIILKREGYRIFSFSNGREFLDQWDAIANELDVIISDIIMPEMDGIALLEQLKKKGTDVPVIMITANTRADYAVETLRQGAYDYITKPFKNDEIKIIIRNAIEKRNLQRENAELKNFLQSDDRAIVFKTKAMEDVFITAIAAAKSTAPVLVIGESGTGKELFAKLIHRESERRDQPFFAVNCAAIPENLMESEFYGYERGAFTGAVISKPGYFELAHKGTLFLDEIGELPVPMQVKLLRAIDDKVILRLGGKEPVAVDVRIVAATNRNLSDDVKKGDFREELFYRLNVVRLYLPSLREKKSDILPLAVHFLRKYCLANGKKIKGFTKDAAKFLEEYHWPGNVRELQNAIERACIFENGEILGVGSLPMDILTSDGERGEDQAAVIPSDGSGELPSGGMKLDQYLHSVEKDMIEKAMARTGGNKKLAADLLGISMWALYHRIDKFKGEMHGGKQGDSEHG